MNRFPPTNDKTAWRRWAKAERRKTDLAAVTPRLLTQITSLPEWEAARHILLYLALPGEIPVERLAETPGKHFYAPRCVRDRQLSLHSFVPNNTSLITTAFGLREPDPRHSPETLVQKMDLVIVPALGFDVRGQRLGYGGGYYDRFLPRLRPDCVTIGVVPDVLLVPLLPSEPHDTAVQIVVTEKRTIRRADTTELTPPPCSG